MTTATQAKWEYKREPAFAKGQDLRTSKVEQLGNEGWEGYGFAPLAMPIDSGVYGLLVGWFLLKRRKG